ncbi:cysteine desulfurase [Collinsella sp. zg1085]|uniref:cysteine desulfurase family protein n=1 Tax=Collinsella sp. zg1085 TaxID=2844380 RepID=UPI001C0C28A7|nr:cysteine desulfurase family protein [Collinsella sp. zg1085]QWT17017.1 cysteine desulfurase [Collinsella sp. zg1085]
MSTRHLINLDFAASTPLRPEAIAAQARYDQADYAGANPHALHSLGRAAARKLERSKRELATCFGARVQARELIFTSGGTEANSLAIFGLARAIRERNAVRNHVVISALEHDSVLHCVPLLKELGFEVSMLSAGRDGRVSADMLTRLANQRLALVACMYANNETGIVQPIAELARIAHESGALMFCDAIQGWLHHPFDVFELGVDALSVAGHKIGGPVASGALYLKAKTPLKPLLARGSQEAGLRSGTQDVRTITAFCAAACSVHHSLSQDYSRLLKISDWLYDELMLIPGIDATVPNIAHMDRVPGIVSVTVEQALSEDLILQLDEAGFAVSAGSACTATSSETSHVLRAMQVPKHLSEGVLRISFDDRVSMQDLQVFVRTLQDIVSR